MKLFYPLILSLFFVSCWNFDRYKPTPMPAIVKAWVPVYGVDSIYKKIEYVDSVHPVRNAGKIYVSGKYILQAETNEGVHIIDNSNPANAKRIGFIKINGCQEIAMKGHYLYTNNYNDLITIDLSSLSNPTVTSRLKNAFNGLGATSAAWYAPPPQRGYYACAYYYPDSVIVAWRQDSVQTISRCIGGSPE